MSNKPALSSNQVIKILEKRFNFYISSQKGSHIKMQNNDSDNQKVTIVPNHKEIAYGTLKGILKLAQIQEKEFWQKYYE